MVDSLRLWKSSGVFGIGIVRYWYLRITSQNENPVVSVLVGNGLFFSLSASG